MERRDELWLPDGRVVPYRRGDTVRPASAVPPASRAVRPHGAPPRGRDRRRVRRTGDVLGQRIDVLA